MHETVHCQDATGAIVVDKPGNVTVIENDGCNVDTFTIGQQFDVVWMWDLAVADLTKTAMMTSSL